MLKIRPFLHFCQAFGGGHGPPAPPLEPPMTGGMPVDPPKKALPSHFKNESYATDGGSRRNCVDVVTHVVRQLKLGNLS